MLICTQPDHAALAQHIMQHWRADGLPESPRRAAILLAVNEHDNGWREVDAAPIVDPATGGIRDFINAPDEVRRSRVAARHRTAGGDAVCRGAGGAARALHLSSLPLRPGVGVLLR